MEKHHQKVLTLLFGNSSTASTIIRDQLYVAVKNNKIGHSIPLTAFALFCQSLL